MGQRGLVCGIGINNADYKVSKKTRIEGGLYKYEKCPHYDRWSSMISRCYSAERLKKSKAYRDCSVCDDWLYFMKFKAWMENQDFTGKHIDKDILIEGNRVYSPEACLFVDPSINLFMSKRVSLRGDCPLGVTYNQDRGKFCSKIRRGKKTINLGRYHNQMDAHRAWQRAKVIHAMDLIESQSDTRVTFGLTRIINKIQNDYDNNMETKTF